MCFVRISTKNLCCVLTFVAYPEADVGVALVSWEEQVEEVGGADKKLGHLGALIAANQRRRGETSVAHLQDVVVDFSAEPANKRTLRNHCLASAGQKKKSNNKTSKLNGEKIKITHTVILFLQRCRRRISILNGYHGDVWPTAANCPVTVCLRQFNQLQLESV